MQYYSSFSINPLILITKHMLYLHYDNDLHIPKFNWTYASTVTFTVGSASSEWIYLYVPVHYFVSS